MKKIILLLSLFISFHSQAFFEDFHYPENRTYTPQDRGMAPYRASSLYKTGTFTLTFDDGPHPTRTAKVLDVLKKHNVKATFFVLTKLLNDSNFHILKRMLDEGHIIGSHGYDHSRASSLSREAWKGNIKKSFQDLAHWYKKAGHEFTKHYYRFPFGEYGTRADYHHINALKEVSIELMGDNCIHMAFWDVDTSDWVPGMTAADVANNIKAHNEGGTYIGFKKVGSNFVKNPMQLKTPPAGGVVLQHDVQEPSINGTDLFLNYAFNQNLKIVRLDEIEEFAVTRNCKL